MSTVRRVAGAAVSAVALACPALATAAVPAVPIPEGTTQAPSVVGAPASPDPVPAPEPPRHPFMAATGKSEIHVDAYQSDSSSWSGPLGRNMSRRSTFQSAECASHTFDAR